MSVFSKRVGSWVCVFWGLLVSSPGWASTDEQVWFQWLALGKPTESFRLWLELQPRYSFGRGAWTTVLVRPGVGWQLSPSWSVWAGHLWLPALGGTAREEQRPWAQAMHASRWGSVSVVHRFRYEFRMFQGARPSSRVRYVLRVAVPVTAGEALSAVVADEIFWSIDGAEGVADAGFDQNRLFVGGMYRWSPHWAVDVGYLWLRQRRPAPEPDRTQHIALVALQTAF
jgi:hypothetical protein